MLTRVGSVEVNVARFDRQLPALWHGVASVDRQIHENLLDLPGVGPNAPEVRPEHRYEIDVFADETAEHLVHVCHDVVEIQYPRLEDLLAAESEQLAGQCGGADSGRHHFSDSFACGCARWQVRQEEFAIPSDDRQEVVEVVGHASGEAPDGLHPLCLAKLLLEPPLLGDVV